MAYQTFTFEVAETIDDGALERLFQSLREIKKDESLKLEERRIRVITTNRADVAAALEPIFSSPKKGWKQNMPKNKDNGSESKDIPEPAGFAPYQEAKN